MADHQSPRPHADVKPRRVFLRRSVVRRAVAASGAAGLAPPAGVKLPGLGVRVEVQSAARNGDAVRVTIGPTGR